MCVCVCVRGWVQVVEQGMFVKHCKVEVYLTELKLCDDGDMENLVTRRFSKADTIGRLHSTNPNTIVSTLDRKSVV